MLKSKRIAPLLVALLLLSAGLTLVGGTFATQMSQNVDYSTQLTDLSADQTLNYNVDLLYYNAAVNGPTGAYTSMLRPNTPVFSSSDLWCPGRTEIVYLKLINAEAFTVDCTLALNVTESGFDDVLSYAVIEEDLLSGTTKHPTNWTDFIAAAQPENKGTLAVTPADQPLKLHEDSKLTLAAGETKYLALGIHMSEGATSDYVGKVLEMSFGLRVDANFAGTAQTN